jgi:hypothetical protein
LFAVLLSGCGDSSSKGTTVKGTLVSDGQPLEVNDPAKGGASGRWVRVTVALYQKDAKKEADLSTDAQPDGTFTIADVPPGEYTLTVVHFDRTMGQGPGQGPPKGGSGAAGAGAAGPGGGGGDPRQAQRAGGSGPPSMDRLEGEFSPEKSQIKVKVGTSSPQDLGTIDLKKPDTWPK